MPFVIAGVFYFIFNAIVGWGMGRVEEGQVLSIIVPSGSG